MELAKTSHANNIDWELWLAEAFNDYRDVYDAADSAPPAKDFAIEVVELTNAERKNNGLYPLEVDDELMQLAQIRAEEVSNKYSHERPDGTTVVETHGCGENVGARKTAAIQVEKWMASEGHRHNILLERYKRIGVGCYKADNSRCYWVQIFKP